LENGFWQPTAWLAGNPPIPASVHAPHAARQPARASGLQRAIGGA